MLHALRLKFNGRIPLSLKSAYLGLRQLDAHQRALPDFLIIGAMKAGTTSLFNYLCQHPRIIGSVPKEIFYLCSHPERGERWYRRHFPRITTLQRKQALCGEASPTYLTSPQAAIEAARQIPNAKLIVLLREPAERAVSHYFHRFRAGREHKTVDQVFSASMVERMASGNPQGETENQIYQRGNYAAGLKDWLDHFSRKQIHIIESEAMFHHPQNTVNEVCKFLEIEPIHLPQAEAFNVAGGFKSRPQNFHQLKQAFHQQNQKLCELGLNFRWVEQS